MIEGIFMKSSEKKYQPMKELIFNNRTIWMMRPYQNVDYSERAILTKSIFNFVDAWLVRKQRVTGDDKPLYFWRQAKHYYQVGIDLRAEVKPLVNYYCCLNAVKCLISLKSISVSSLYHGVKWIRSNLADLSAQIIELKPDGALKLLRTILGADDGDNSYSAQELLYNLVVIQRAFTYTYPGNSDLFIPLDNLKFYKSDANDKISVAFEIKKNQELSVLQNNIPTCFEVVTKSVADWNVIKTMTRNDQIRWCHEHNKLFFKFDTDEAWDESETDSQKAVHISSLHRKVRPYFQYINSDSPMWYLKKQIPGNTMIHNYSSPVITFALMHCFSEMVRYEPYLFEELKKEDCAWLITEFIEVGMDQFIDEIAGEITEYNIMLSGVKGKR